LFVDPQVTPRPSGFVMPEPLMPMIREFESASGGVGLRRAVALLGMLVLSGPVFAAGDEERPGDQIYRQECARCHGPSGEGTPEDFPRPLAGDKTVSQLARLIARTMPEDDPGTCTANEAAKVAAYIHDAFYSKAAQARNAPARIELSRLTVRQYRSTLTDLVGSFREPAQWDDRRGLHGEYYNARRIRSGNRVLERIDPMVKFDFGEESPVPEKMDAEQFSIRWEGSLLAPETGDYEIIVRTEHAVRVWLNDNNRPLIDALVKSSNDTEHHASIFLLAGYTYPLRLEFSKAKQGVDDSKKQKVKPPPRKASIALEWKLPHRAAEVIPERCLSPKGAPERFVVTAAFPPDDRSVGYERGSSVSKAWDQATTDGAIETAAYVVSHLREFSGASDSGDDRAERFRDFCRRFAARAFRRPLSDELKTKYVDRQFEGGGDLEAAVKRVVLLVLKSPRFLYREIGSSGRDAYDVAARISYALWDSLPDQALLDAAAGGRLGTADEVARQAERGVGDLRSRAKLREFLLQWLRVDPVPDLAKDPEKFPGFDAAIASDLRTSLDLFLEDVVWSESSDFRRLLLGEELFLNGRLAKFYGADLAPDAPFQKVVMESGQRAGIVSHPYLMATFAYTGASSPIHRGVFLSRSVLGRSLRPPPEAAAPLPPDLHPDLTTRERVSLQTKPAACVTCHGMINPLGFPLESFDAVGRFRSEENGKTIDPTGYYQTRTGETANFTGARALAAFLAGSDETHDAFVEQLFHHMVKQPIRAFGSQTLDELRASFARNGYNIRKLMIEIVGREAVPAPETRAKAED
jgi:mono/diheme cytochrome c family protein